MSVDEHLAHLTRRMDKADMQMDAVLACVRKLEEADLATRTTLIEHEVASIKEDVAVLPELALTIREMRAANRMARGLFASLLVVAVPLVSYLYSEAVHAPDEAIQAIREDLKDLRSTLETHSH